MLDHIHCTSWALNSRAILTLDWSYTKLSLSLILSSNNIGSWITSVDVPRVSSEHTGGPKVVYMYVDFRVAIWNYDICDIYVAKHLSITGSSTGLGLGCLTTPGHSKDIQCHVWPYFSKLANHHIRYQVTHQVGGSSTTCIEVLHTQSSIQPGFKTMIYRSWTVPFMSLRSCCLNHEAIRDHIYSDIPELSQHRPRPLFGKS